jgi:hypothetical protein
MSTMYTPPGQIDVSRHIDVSDETVSGIKAGLEKPFPDHVIQTRKGNGNQTVAYVDVSAVIYRLNEVCGDLGWSFVPTGFQFLPHDESVICMGSMTIPGLGTRGDIGSYAARRDQPINYKAAASDCLKRCARQFGVGLGLWAADVEAGEVPNAPYGQFQGGGQPAPPRQQSAPVPGDPYPPAGGWGGNQQGGGQRTQQGSYGGGQQRQSSGPSERQMKFARDLLAERNIEEDVAFRMQFGDRATNMASVTVQEFSQFLDDIKAGKFSDSHDPRFG